MICPCKDCENKGCGIYHSQCKDYLKYVEWKKSINEKERRNKRFSPMPNKQKTKLY